MCGYQTLPVPATPMRLEGDMIGCWTNPLGIPGLSLCDVGMGFGIDLQRLNPTPAILVIFCIIGTGFHLTIQTYVCRRHWTTSESRAASSSAA